MYLAAALVIMAAAFAARYRLRKRTPVLRCKAGESGAEAGLILRGTFRVYSWTLALTLSHVVISGILGDYAPAWLLISGMGFAVTLLVLARAIYWRLGYDADRTLLVLGHLSGVFALSESLFALPAEVLAVTGTPTVNVNR